MEHTEHPETKSVHILRPRFEASPGLLTNIQSLLNEERRYTTPIEFYGTHHSVIDLLEYNNYVHGHKIHDVEEAFVNTKKVVRLSRQLKLQQISANKVRMMVRPIEQAALNRLLADMHKIPHVVEQPVMNHYAYADISISALLRTKQENERAMAALDIGSQLSSITPLKFSGYDHFYTINPEAGENGSGSNDELRTAS